MTCQKVKHKTREGAVIAARKVKNTQLNVFWCKPCGAWHLGSSRNPLRKMDRINQLLDRVVK